MKSGQPVPTIGVDVPIPEVQGTPKTPKTPKTANGKGGLKRKYMENAVEKVRRIYAPMLIIFDHFDRSQCRVSLKMKGGRRQK